MIVAIIERCYDAPGWWHVVYERDGFACMKHCRSEAQAEAYAREIGAESIERPCACEPA